MAFPAFQVVQSELHVYVPWIIPVGFFFSNQLEDDLLLVGHLSYKPVGWLSINTSKHISPVSL